MSDFFVQNVWMIPCLPLLGALIAAIGAAPAGVEFPYSGRGGHRSGFSRFLARSSRQAPRRPPWRDPGCRSAIFRSPSSSGSTG